MRHDILTEEGRRISVVNLREGGREFAIADEDDPDRAGEAIDLTDDEATALSEILGGSLILTQLAGLPEQVGEAMPHLDGDAQRALQFTRSAPGITVALAGMANPEHVAQNLGLAKHPPADLGRWFRQ